MDQTDSGIAEHDDSSLLDSNTCQCSDMLCSALLAMCSSTVLK